MVSWNRENKEPNRMTCVLLASLLGGPDEFQDLLFRLPDRFYHLDAYKQELAWMWMLDAASHGEKNLDHLVAIGMEAEKR